MIHLSRDGGNTVTLRHFQLPHKTTPAAPGQRLIRAVVVDVETTGLEVLSSEVIEIAVRPFDFDINTGDVVNVYEGYCGLQEPKTPLPPRITEITGIKPEDLVGKEIDWQRAYSMIKDGALVIAHNAKFDRKQIEYAIQRWDYTKATDPAWVRKNWACTLEGLEWGHLSSPSKSLSVLCWLHGFYYVAHRAMDDVDATLNLLIESKLMLSLYATAMFPVCEIWANGSPFESKDRLKERKYKWAGESKCWVHPGVYAHEVDAEFLWLQQNVYGQAPMKNVKVNRLESWQRYK